MGPFEEEEEGSGIGSDVPIEGWGSGNSRSPDLRNDPGPLYFPISGQQNKPTHTPTLVVVKNGKIVRNSKCSEVAWSHGFTCKLAFFGIQILHEIKVSRKHLWHV